MRSSGVLASACTGCLDVMVRRGERDRSKRMRVRLLPLRRAVDQDRAMPSIHYSLPFAGLVLLILFLAWHYRHLYVDRLPPALSSRIRHYTPLRTFEDAAEQGTLCHLGWLAL